MACFCCCDFLRFSIPSLLQGLTRWWHLRAPTEVQTPTQGLHLRAPTEVQTPIHRLRARFLKSFLDCSERWQIEVGKLKAPLGCLELQLKDAYGELDGQISFIGEKHMSRQTWMHISTYIRDVYDILTQTARSMLVMTREAHVMGALESLLGDTEDLLKLEADSILPVKKELEAVDKSLRFLKSFLYFTENTVDRKVEMRKNLLAHADAMAHCIACLLYLYCSVNDKIDDHTAHHMKMELEVQLEKIKPVQPEIREIYVQALKAERQLPNPDILKGVNESALVVLDFLLENLIELSEAKIGPITSFKDQILALHQELKLLKNFLIDPLRKTSYHIQHQEQFGNFCGHTYSLTIESGYVIFSLYDADNDQNKVTKLRAALSNLQAKVEFAKGAVRETYDKLIPKLVLSNFPRTNFQGFITSFLQKLVKYSEADSVVKDDIIAVQRELLCLRDDFCKIAKIRRQHEELNHHWAHFIDVAYQAEHVIESLVVRGSPLLHLKFCLFDVIEEIKMIRTELNNTQLEMTKYDLLVQEEAKFPRPISPGLDYLPYDALLSSRDFADHGTMDHSAELVTFDKEAERIQNLLASEEKELQIVSIVGLPGIGKTTLADSVYGSVAFCFNIRARVCVSKAYQQRKLLLDLLQGVTGETEKFVKMDDEELEHRLQRVLKCQRYLIFMDDIWDTKDGSRLEPVFQMIKTRVGLFSQVDLMTLLHKQEQRVLLIN